MTPLKGFQKKYLRGLAHDLKPIVLIGKEGLMAGVIKAVDRGARASRTDQDQVQRLQGEGAEGRDDRRAGDQEPIPKWSG